MASLVEILLVRYTAAKKNHPIGEAHEVSSSSLSKFESGVESSSSGVVTSGIDPTFFSRFSRNTKKRMCIRLLSKVILD